MYRKKGREGKGISVSGAILSEYDKGVGGFSVCFFFHHSFFYSFSLLLHAQKDPGKYTSRAARFSCLGGVGGENKGL